MKAELNHYIIVKDRGSSYVVLNCSEEPRKSDTIICQCKKSTFWRIGSDPDWRALDPLLLVEKLKEIEPELIDYLHDTPQEISRKLKAIRDERAEQARRVQKMNPKGFYTAGELLKAPPAIKPLKPHKP